MTEKPDYLKLNPKMMQMVNGLPTPMGIEFHIYNQDGTSNGITLPTTDELLVQSLKVLEVMASKDARYIYNVLTEMTSMVEVLIHNTMGTHHAYVHTQPPTGYDEDVLCHGIREYLNNVTEGVEVTPDTSERYVLETFFTGNQKPN
jgi:hypothetical protein